MSKAGDRQERYRRRHPEKIAEARAAFLRTERYRNWNATRARVTRAANRAYWIERLGGRCVDCGFSDARALDFDHVDPGTKAASMSRLLANVQPGHPRLEAEALKCVLRCRNCHQIRTIEERHHGRFRD